MEMPNIRFKEYREYLGLSIPAFSEKTGLTERRLKNIESGKARVRVDVAINVSNAFNVSMDYLLGRIDDPLPKFWSEDDRNFLEHVRNLTPESKKAFLEKMEELQEKEQHSS